jgi:hypothetical protein
MQRITPDRSIFILTIGLCLLIGWVFWLPAAKTAYFFRYEPNYPNPDFVAYYIAGQAFDKGYNPYLDNHAADASLFDVRPDGFSRFIYPPTFMPLYSLFGKLPYKYARAIWAGLNLAVLGGAFSTLVLRSKKGTRLPFFIFGAVLLLTSQPLLFHIQQGQIDMLMAGLGIFAYAAYERKHKFLSAFLLALAVFAKLSPVILLATFIFFHRDLEYLLKFCLVSAGIFVVSLLVVPFNLYSDFVTLILPVISSGRGFFVNQSLIRLVAYAGALPGAISLAGFGSFTLFAWWQGTKARKSSMEPGSFIFPTEQLRDIIFLMNILVMLLFSGVAWHMAFVWLIIPASKVLGNIYHSARIWFLAVFLVACILVNSTVDEPLYLQSLNMIGGSLMLISLLFLVLFPRIGLLTPKRQENVSNNP